LGGLSLFFPAEDPALIGRCYRRLIAPLSGPIKDQDLRVVAPVLRLSDVAVVVSHMLISFSQILFAAGVVSFREIIRGAGKFFLRQSEVLGGAKATTVVVAAMVAVMAMVAMVAMVVVVVLVLVVEQIIQETSDEASRKKTWEHSYSPLSPGMPAPASCRRSGACRRGD
jgi:hypothetical protein